MQLVLAGSDSQGLRYGTTGTRKSFFVEWKERKDKGTATSEPLPPRWLLAG